jgi:hypothetical protein
MTDSGGPTGPAGQSPEPVPGGTIPPSSAQVPPPPPPGAPTGAPPTGTFAPLPNSGPAFGATSGPASGASPGPAFGASSGPAFGATPGPAPGPSGPAASSFNLNVRLPTIDAGALSKTPWVLGAASILAALVLYWVGSAISALESGLSFRGAILNLLAPGRADWAVAVLFAVALLALASTAEDKRSGMSGFLYQLLLLAAALIAAAAIVNAVIWLTYIGDSFAGSLSGILDSLAAVPIAAAAGLWAWRLNPGAIPGVKVPGT